MKHVVLYQRQGFYTGWPLPGRLPDGRLFVVVQSSPFAEHYALGERVTLVSDDDGESWSRSDDPALPPNWPGSSTRECHDRFAGVLADGTWLAAGGVGWEVWPPADRERAERLGLLIRQHPDPNSDHIIVGGHRVFVQWSTDEGATWNRREWQVPGASRLVSFPRPALLADGTVLVPVYDLLSVYVLRITAGPTCELIPLPGSGRLGNEFGVVETEPGTVLAHIRHAPQDKEGDGYLLEAWSDDGGLTWSHALQTGIWGYPPHLLKLRDGRILCSRGYRRDPMGVRAVLSSDGGRSWDLAKEVVLRDDAVARWGNPLAAHSPGDVGYPLSVERADGRIFTAYYFPAEDGTVHAAATTWEVDGR